MCDALRGAGQRLSAPESQVRGGPLPVGRFLFTREDYELEASASPASTCSTSAVRTLSSIAASFTKARVQMLQPCLRHGVEYGALRGLASHARFPRR